MAALRYKNQWARLSYQRVWYRSRKVEFPMKKKPLRTKEAEAAETPIHQTSSSSSSALIPPPGSVCSLRLDFILFRFDFRFVTQKKIELNKSGLSSSAPFSQSCRYARTVSGNMCRQESHVRMSSEEEIAAEESLSIYCKPVEFYNILQRRAIRNVPISCSPLCFICAFQFKMLSLLLNLCLPLCNGLPAFLFCFAHVADFSSKMFELQKRSQAQKEVIIVIMISKFCSFRINFFIYTLDYTDWVVFGWTLEYKWQFQFRGMREKVYKPRSSFLCMCFWRD